MQLVYCDFMAGCIGGAYGIIVAHPLDTIKTWQQATNSSINKSIYDIIIRNNGLNGFYRGMMFPLFTTGAINSILFGIYGNELRNLENNCKNDEERKKKRDRNIFIAGSIAGFIQSFIACPMELIKIRLQTRNYLKDYRKESRGPVGCMKKIWQQDGLIGFYRGILPTIFRDVFPYGIYMLAYEQILANMGNLSYVKEQRAVNKLKSNSNSVNNRLEMMLTVISGSIAGFLSWIVIIPFDVMKTIMQAETDSVKYKNMFHCIETNIKMNGWKILFRGSWMIIFRALPVNAATFLGYEYALEKCNNFYKIK